MVFYRDTVRLFHQKITISMIDVLISYSLINELLTVPLRCVVIITMW